MGTTNAAYGLILNAGSGTVNLVGVGVAGDGMTRVADLQTRRRATIKGTIYSVILRPRSGVLALEIEIEDGTGRVRCIWLGRRTIHGLTAGRDIVVTALFTRDKQTWVGFNPMYQLMPNAQ